MVGLPADPLGLERREEALHGRIVPDIAGPAHRALHAVVGHQLLELLFGLLASLIRVMEQSVGLSAPPDRITCASATSCSVISAFIDQPTARCENRSMTAAT